MKTDKQTIEILVRAFFNSFFTRLAGTQVRDVTKAQPVTIKQLLMANIDDVSRDFNARIPKAFALINGVEIPERLSKPKTFEGSTALIRYTLGGSADMYGHMVERYKYHFTLALSGTVEKADITDDTDILRALEMLK